ncbi:MAG: stage II sporulation protein P [Clostridia bacterium]|nr:stage II sporulation protein P [Clostridia bacterium]
MRYKHKRYDDGPTFFDWLLLILLWGATLFIIAVMARDIILAQSSFASTEQSIEPSASELEPSQSPTPSPTLEPLTVALDRREGPLLDLRGDSPKILIYHTHTTEAYTQTEQYTYVEASSWRTLDESRSVVAVGEALKEALEQTYGFNVIHDRTNHEPPSLSTSYERSQLTIEQYLKLYPSIVLVIDLHRDAYTVTDEPTTDYATVYDDETARIMFVVGKGTNYEDKPDFDTNYALAKSITDRLNELNPRLTREVRVKDGRYNQHLCPYSLLVEVGHNANTLEQALAVVPYLADGIALACAELEAEGERGSEVLNCFVPID